MKRLKSILGPAAACILLAACSQANSAPPTLNSVNNGSPSYSKLQFAVGTANVAGTQGLNVVSTLRQPNGDSADLVDSPSITLPFSLSGQTPGSPGGPDGYSTAFSTGPSNTEIGGNALTGTPQTLHPGAPPCAFSGGPGCDPGEAPNVTTFGVSGGVFGMGLQPANNTINGTAYSYVPYSEPIFSSGTQFVPWGGPPAFDDSSNGMGTRDGLHNLGAGLLGWNQGITIFDFTGLSAANYAGSYTMNVVIPTGPSTTATVSASASITSTAMLPAVTAPAMTEDGNGGGSFSGVTLPAGATEGYIEIVDLGGAAGSCQGVLGASQFAPDYYTIVVKPGTTSYSLPDNDGPNTTQNGASSLTPSHTICTGDNYSVQFFAMDYPLYEASYPASKAQAPAIVGGAGQDDITISAASGPFTY